MDFVAFFVMNSIETRFQQDAWKERTVTAYLLFPPDHPLSMHNQVDADRGHLSHLIQEWLQKELPTNQPPANYKCILTQNSN